MPGQTEFGLEEAHREFAIAPDEFDEVAAELERSLDHFHVPKQEKDEVLAAFYAHKHEVTTGYDPAAVSEPRAVLRCRRAITGLSREFRRAG
jgi:hemoglobin